MERKDELEARVRETPLSERLSDCRKRIGKMCSEGRPPRMCIPVQWDDDDFYISTTLADAQRALDAEREKVAKLEKIQAIDLKNNNEYREQLATLQAQLRQVEGERDAARHRVDELESREIDVEILQGDLDTLRQLVEALPVCVPASLQIFDTADGNGYDVHGAIKEPYSVGWIGTFLHKAEAESYIRVLKARAALAAQGAGEEDVSHE